MDYRRAMGVKALPSGDGVHIAVLDSGVPMPTVIGMPCTKSIRDAYIECCDQNGHATAIASILFGNGKIKGICPKATPHFIKVLDSDGNGDVESVVDGIYKAIEQDVDLINLSLGFCRVEECPDSLEKACKKAFESGKTIICAAGNDGGPVNWPAALKTTLCVGAADQKGHKVEFSSVGEVDFVAPGVNLPVFGLYGAVKLVSGTSFATALITGMAALLVSASKPSKMGLEQVKNDLRKLAIDIDAPGWDDETGYGLVLGDAVNPVNLKIKTSIFGTILKRVLKFLGITPRQVRSQGI